MNRTAGSTRAAATIVAVTSGKGGVGKTSLTVNLAASLARLGYRAGILDADFGLGNVDVMLGLTPPSHVGAVLAGERTIDDVSIEGPDGIRIIPAGSGIRALTSLNREQWARLRRCVVSAGRGLDVLLVDTAPGIDDTVIELARLADHVIVVTAVEPTAIVDAYAMLKLLHHGGARDGAGIVVNATRDDQEGQLVYRQLRLAVARFLNQSLRYYGSIADDPGVRDAVLEQRPIVSRDPESPASRGYRRLALRIANLSPTDPAAASAIAPVTQTPLTDREFLDMEAPRCA
jgi:flagellar biosynthesis protein FlhG